MGDLGVDTRVEPADGNRWSAKLSPDWEIWGPNGGYLASVALRAAGLATGRARPASLVGHFLGVAAFERVDLDVDILRTSRFATSARVRMGQDGRPVLEALVWGVDPGGVALEHDVAPAPDVPPPEDLQSLAERRAALPPDQRRPALRFDDNVDHRPTTWPDELPPSAPGPPVTTSWNRFVPTARFDDRWLDACRLLIPVDTYGWPAAARAYAHVDPPQAVAVTVDLSVRFHRPTADEWLLVEAVSPVATGGLVAATARVWDRSGALVASGDQTMMCRPTG